MKFTVLGCYSPYPGKDGGTPGYLLEVKDKKLLLDCGSGVLSILNHFMPVYLLDGVFLSHLHHDHISDFFVLQYAILTAMKLGKRKEPLSVWAPKEPSSWFSKLYYEDYIEVNEINENTTVDLKDSSIHFHRTAHGEHCYAMEINEGQKKLLYGADSGPDTKWHTMCNNPDLFVCEATYLTPDVPAAKSNRHLSSHQAGLAAQSIHAKHLLLTHLFPEYPREMILKEAKKVFSNKLSLAYPGWTCEL